MSTLTSMQSDTALIVYFHEDDTKLLKLWKLRVLGLYGVGGIKKRIRILLSKDLKEIEALK